MIPSTTHQKYLKSYSSIIGVIAEAFSGHDLNKEQEENIGL